MKRGLLRECSDRNSKTGQDINCRKRRPCRIEERLRLRRQQDHKNKSLEIYCAKIAEEQIAADEHRDKVLLTSSDSSSADGSPKIHNSKQRVDLLELAFHRMSLNRTKNRNENWKVSNEKRQSRSPCRNFDGRPRSAPCTPLFKMKCAKHNCCRDIFVNYKIVEKECIEERKYPCFCNKTEVKECRSHECQRRSEKLYLPSDNLQIQGISCGSEDQRQIDLPCDEATNGVADVDTYCKETHHQQIPQSTNYDVEHCSSSKSVEDQKLQAEFQQFAVSSDHQPCSNIKSILPFFSRNSLKLDNVNVCNKKPVKSHAFKWQTLLEKRHCATSPCYRDHRHSHCCRCNETLMHSRCNGLCASRFARRRQNLSPKRVSFRLPSSVMENVPDADETRNECVTNRKQELPTNENEDEVQIPEQFASLRISDETDIPRNSPRSKHSNNNSCCKGVDSNKEKNGGSVPEMETCLEVSRESESRTTISSERDWALGPEDNSGSSVENISFPKETRQAMSVLLHSREDIVKEMENCKDPETDKQLLKEVKVLENPDLRIFHNAAQKAMHVATYAQALAVFQRTCDPLAGGCCRKKRHIVRKRSYGELETLTGNMQTNGSDGGSTENGAERSGWTVGLINGRYKYLTAETFGFKINANGASLKKKQLWSLEGTEHQVYLRSHLDRYLAVDQFGNVTCEAEDHSDPGCSFQIQVASDGSGRWALKNVQRGYFLGSSQDELKCTAKAPSDAEYWLVHLAARPQVNLRSAGRKRFAHLSAAQDEIHVDAPVPWGEDTLFTLEFRPAANTDDNDARGDQARTDGGHYALHTCNNKYLARDGKLLDSCTRDCLYAAEFHAGLLALRDVSGAYLAPIGSKAVLKSRSNTVTRDELFSLEDSLPQASFVAALNQRYVSVKQGVDVTANQDEISGHETFQLEFDRATKRWYVRTMQDRYWTLEAGGGIQASEHKRSSNALFDLVWQPQDGTVALRANNGKFLATKRSGHLYANADSPTGGDSDACKYHFYLMNRPVLVLRGEQGFVGLKSAASPKLECNKASYETIRVERCDRGVVRFKGQNGKYWHADSESVTADSDVPTDGFYLELREPSRICIKSTDGRYLSAGKNGVFRLGETDYESATKWEF